MADRLIDVGPTNVQEQVGYLLATRLYVSQHVLDAMAESQD